MSNESDGELRIGENIDISGETFNIEEKLGKGSFGSVYLLRCVKDPKRKYAMKTEYISDVEMPVLTLEIDVLQRVKRKKAQHFCNVFYKGKMNNFTYLVMTCMGKSLADLRKQCNNSRFSLSTALRVAIQTMEAIGELHDYTYYIHRDIKPGNFAIGRADCDDQRNVYILDFGLCRHYRTADGRLKNPRAKCDFRGTIRYASLPTHYLKDQSRRDDLESWFYMVAEMTRGSLMWKSCADIDMVQKMKEGMRKSPKEHLGRECPAVYLELLNYIDGLKFKDVPDHKYLIRLLDRKMKRSGISWNELYDWEPKTQGTQDTLKKERKQLMTSGTRHRNSALK